MWCYAAGRGEPTTAELFLSNECSFKDQFAFTCLKADLVIHDKGSLQKRPFKFCKTSPDPL